MRDGWRSPELLDAVKYLSFATDELVAAGYEAWADELRELIETIRLEISWLAVGDDEP